MKSFIMMSVAALILPMTAFAQTGASSISAQDRSFVTTAAAAGLSEVQEGQLAASKGDRAVQNIGNRMVTDHTKANNALSALASSKGLTVPDHVTDSQAAELTHLQGLSGAAFDSAYLEDQHRAHVEAIELFEMEAKSGSDADIKTFATNTLPTLKMHLHMIKAAQ